MEGYTDTDRRKEEQQIRKIEGYSHTDGRIHRHSSMERDTDRCKNIQTQIVGRIEKHRQMEGYTDTKRW